MRVDSVTVREYKSVLLDVRVNYLEISCVEMGAGAIEIDMD